MTKYIINTPKKCYKRKITLSLLKVFSRARFLIVAGLLIIISIGYYVQLIMENTVKNYKIRDLQAKIEELQKENRRLEVASANHQSAVNLNSQIQSLGMVLSDKVEYISIFDKTMAKR